jgi:ribosomal-protein-serine acetyltransferase
VGGLVCHAIHWESRKTEIGYWLAAEAVGKGLATQAARAALDYLFRELKLNRVEILCAVDNERSQAIPKRLGFTQEGVLRQAHWITNRYVDHALYALLAEEWR